MNPNFSIEVEWCSSEEKTEELRHTSSLLEISINDQLATHVEDDWAKTVSSRIRVSAYPLAIWFASSWWRLRWEPSHKTINPLDWKLSHELPSAGYGYIWPRITFLSDGENIEIHVGRSMPDPIEPIHYLNSFQSLVPANVMEREIDSFIHTVISRLETVGSHNTELADIWKIVTEERHSPASTRYRRLEASLGYDPDEAPESIISELIDLSSKVGSNAIHEIAPAFSDHTSSIINDITAYEDIKGIDGSMENLSLHPDIRKSKGISTPWEKGWQLAKTVKEACGIGEGPIDNKILSDLINIDSKIFKPDEHPHTSGNLSLAIKKEESKNVRLLFRRTHYQGRRFEAARFIADYLLASHIDNWLPLTDLKTSRQKLQRAFAAEFLCPINSLKERMLDDYSDESLEEAGNYFDVSPLAIKSHLANNGLIEPETVSSYYTTRYA